MTEHTIHIGFRLWLFKGYAYGVLLPLYWIGVLSKEAVDTSLDSLGDLCLYVRTPDA